jgi:hypothetical protein
VPSSTIGGTAKREAKRALSYLRWPGEAITVSMLRRMKLFRNELHSSAGLQAIACDGLIPPTPSSPALGLSSSALEFSCRQPVRGLRSVCYRKRDPHQHSYLLGHPLVRE